MNDDDHMNGYEYISPQNVTSFRAALEVAGWYRSEARWLRGFNHRRTTNDAAFVIEHAAKVLETISVSFSDHVAEPRGTFACPICGQDRPHSHTEKEIEDYRANDREGLLAIARIVDPMAFDHRFLGNHDVEKWLKNKERRIEMALDKAENILAIRSLAAHPRTDDEVTYKVGRAIQNSVEDGAERNSIQIESSSDTASANAKSGIE